MRKSTQKLTALTIILFLGLSFYLGYLQVVKGEELAFHPLNPRLSAMESERLRGNIIDRQGRILAQSVGQKGDTRRQYPLAEAAAHVVGYASRRFGNSGLEAVYAAELLGVKGWHRIKNQVVHLTGHQVRGLNLVLTLDGNLQELAYRLLAGRRGAIVALDPRTGAVLALASSPSFNPNDLAAEMERFTFQPENSPLLNRATQGFYPPGSTLKLVTAAAVLSSNPVVAGRRFVCPGFLEINGRRLHCPYPHGAVSFEEALMYSCNVTFATLALEAGEEVITQTAKSFGFNQDLPFELPSLNSKLAAAPGLTPNELAEVAIGQGEVTVTPLHMALIAAGVANRGLIMRPFIVAKIQDAEGRLIRQAKPRLWRIAAGATTMEAIAKAMEATVMRGTGQAAQLPGVRVAGKTGSAQNPQGKAHAWFVGFAPVENPRIAIAVIVENGGAGGAVAAPLARDVIVKAIEVVE